MQPKVINQQQKLKVSVTILSLNNWEMKEMHIVDQKLAPPYESFQLLLPHETNTNRRQCKWT